MGGVLCALVIVAAAGFWHRWGEAFVQFAAVATAASVVWSKVVAPLVFRPIGKALARGARNEAQGVITELVQPQVDELKRGQAALAHQIVGIDDQVSAILDRMPPDQ